MQNSVLDSAGWDHTHTWGLRPSSSLVVTGAFTQAPEPVWASSPSRSLPIAAKEQCNGVAGVVPRKPDSLQCLHVPSTLQVWCPSPLLRYFPVERLTGLRVEQLCLPPCPGSLTLDSVPVPRADLPCLIALASLLGGSGHSAQLSYTCHMLGSQGDVLSLHLNNSSVPSSSSPHCKWKVLPSFETARRELRRPSHTRA